MTESPRIRDRLQALPEIELPESLWLRVQAGSMKKARMRKLGMGTAGLALVAIMATAMLGLPHLDQPPVQIAIAPAEAAQDAASELRAIDQALQAAYDRGASDAEIAPMWVVRNALLAETQQNHPKPPTNRT